MLEKDFIANYSAISLAFKKTVVGSAFSPLIDKNLMQKTG
jgi:hypothetical protein